MMCRSGRILSPFLLLAALILNACQPLMPADVTPSAATANHASVPAQEATGIQKVLLIPREESEDLEFTLTNELQVMRTMLEDAGFEVVVATDSGAPLSTPGITVEPELTLAEVDVSDYAGVIMACMAAGDPGPVPDEAIKIVQEAVAQGKPVAAQRGAVLILGRAGLLAGKEYAYRYYAFPEGHFVGTGVVQDGNIITSGTCPYAARSYGTEDGTSELTSKLIEILSRQDPQSAMPVDIKTPVEAESAGSEADVATTAWDEIFVIGTVDRSFDEFATEDIDRNREYLCDIGSGCSVDDIPAGLYSGSSPYDFDIPQLTLVFPLNRTYEEVVLHLYRAGSETTKVSVDGGEPLLVTGEMLGSRDGWVFGSYDLALGSLPRGTHSLTLSVADDGKGNGRYQWDALSLTAR